MCTLTEIRWNNLAALKYWVKTNSLWPHIPKLTQARWVTYYSNLLCEDEVIKLNFLILIVICQEWNKIIDWLNEFRNARAPIFIKLSKIYTCSMQFLTYKTYILLWLARPKNSIIYTLVINYFWIYWHENLYAIMRAFGFNYTCKLRGKENLIFAIIEVM